MYEIEDILSAARTLRPRLDELLGTDAETVISQLDKLLAQAEAGQAVEDDMMELLTKYEPTRNELNALLDGEQKGEKSYAPLPGDSSKPVATSEYVCPNEGGCTCGDYPTGWDRLSIDEPIPICPKRNQPLIIN